MITSFSGDYAFLSNFFELQFSAPLTLPGFTPYETRWPTVEHFFQASKAQMLGDAWRIQDAETPGIAKRMGRRVDLRPDWDRVKLSTMLRGVQAKFQQNEAFAELLVATYPQDLIEGNTWGDRYWGATPSTCGAWLGDNWLGKILMFVREELR